MLVVRNCFVAKPGNASKLAAQLKEAAVVANIPRHRVRTDVVDRGRSDHETAAAGTDIRGRGATASVAVYACRLVPAGAVSQRHDHSGRIGTAERFQRHSQRTADRSFAELVTQRCGLHRGCAGHDPECGADRERRRRQVLRRSLRVKHQSGRTNHLAGTRSRVAE